MNGIVSTKAYSQATTQEEYNYVTNGIKFQIQNGLDPKSGYKFVNKGSSALSFGSEKRECKFIALVRDGDIHPCAILAYFKRIDNSTEHFICIPSVAASQEIWDECLKNVSEIFANNSNALETMVWALMKLSAQEMAR